MIKILNQNLECVETIREHISVIFNLKFTEHGDFTLALSPLYNSRNIIKNNYIVHKNNVGIIKYISKTESGLTVRGYCVKGLLKQRVCCGVFNGPIETVVKTIVTDNTQGNRAYIGFVVSEDLKRGAEITYEAKGETVSEALHNICSQNNYGWKIELVGKQLIFDIAEPQQRDVYYSVRHGNISGYEYNLDALSEITTAEDRFIDKGAELYLDDEGIYRYVFLSPGQLLLNDNKTVFILKEPLKIVQFLADKAFYAYVNSSGEPAVLVTSETASPTVYPYRKLGYINDSTSGNFYLYETKVNEVHNFSYKDEYIGLERVETYKKQRFETEEESEKRLEKEVENATALIISYEDYNNKWELGDTIKLRIDVYGKAYIFEKQIDEVQLVEEVNNKRVVPTFGSTKNLLKKLLKQGGI